MGPPPLLNFDQIRAETHVWEVLAYGLVLITDKQNGNSFICIPMNPPKYLSAENLAYVRRFYSDNRRFTSAETELLRSVVLAPGQALFRTNGAAILKWYEEVEKVVGAIATKPTPEALSNPLYWDTCPVEVELQSGEVYPCAVISQRAPYVGEPDNTKHLLLKEVVEIRVSPFAVPKAVLEAAGGEGVEVHMGDAFYAAEAGGKYFAIDTYYDFRPAALFFKNGNVRGSDLRVTPAKTTESVLSRCLFSEAIEYVVVDGLW